MAVPSWRAPWLPAEVVGAPVISVVLIGLIIALALGTSIAWAARGPSRAVRSVERYNRTRRSLESLQAPEPSSDRGRIGRSVPLADDGDFEGDGPSDPLAQDGPRREAVGSAGSWAPGHRRPGAEGRSLPPASSALRPVAHRTIRRPEPGVDLPGLGVAPPSAGSVVEPNRRLSAPRPDAVAAHRRASSSPLTASVDRDEEQSGGVGLGALARYDESPIGREVAKIVGLDEGPRRDPTVEANARVTGTTGLVLIVLLFLEGLTIPFIGRLVTWHILIGLVLIPPLLVKMASVSWRFSRYYLHDPRYRRAGPPHPLLRVLGPLVMLTTIGLFASGIALWLEGPGASGLLRIHQVVFVLWFIVVAVHVLSHVLRASKLAAADSADAHGGRRVDPARRSAARRRRRLVAASLLVGLLLGVLGRTVSSRWFAPDPYARVTHATASTTAVHHEGRG
jgi:hypothetical protein